jgi:hypothetical protein|tara:strand:- start:38 stop:235 length:198 start_codon:yes stop_codon:yes gene_type:complete
MRHQVLELLNDKLEEHLKLLQQAVGDGSAKSFDHYKELCGNIRGLQTAQLEIADLVRKLKDSDDD